MRARRRKRMDNFKKLKIRDQSCALFSSLCIITIAIASIVITQFLTGFEEI